MATAIREVRIETKPLQERVMNAVNGLTRVVVCGLAAVVLTAASSWTFVASTADAYFASDMPTVIILAKAEVAPAKLVQAAATGLLQ
jgi:hypothetical protein